MKFAVVAGVIVLLLAGAGAVAWHQFRNHLGEARVLAALDTQIGAQKIHFTELSLEPLPSTAPERTYRFKAAGALTHDLFTRLDTTELIGEQSPEDLAPLQSLTNELATPAGTHLVELARLGTPPADPLGFIILERSAAAGQAISATGQLTATRGPDGWVVEVGTSDLQPSLPLGKPRASHPAEARIAGPELRQTLAAAVAARLAFAEKMEAARVQVAEQLQQERDARQASLLVALQPSALFLGTAEPVAPDAEPAPGLVLEISSVKVQTRQLNALLRNAGNWSDTRAFTGEWTTDAEFTAFELELATRSSQAIADAGPLLALRESWTITLVLDPAGRLTGQSPTHRYTFTRVASADLERVRTELSAAHDAALAATRAGAVYQGTVTPTGGGEAAPALLRFTRQDSAGAKLEAELSLLAQPNRTRVFRGFVAANPHRTGDQPLRLRSEARRRHSRAEAASVVGLAEDLDPAFRLQGDTLAGADGRFVYSFRLSDSASKGAFDPTGPGAPTGFLARIHAGSVFDGLARHRDGFTTPVRIRFTSSDDEGAVAAVVESRQRPGINARLEGSIDFSERRLRLVTTGGRPDKDRDLRLPFFIQNAKYSVVLAFGERGFEGTIEHDADWRLEFETGRTPAPPADLPEWPQSIGAYALVDGGWQRLPTNNGHPVNSANARLAKLTTRGTDDPTRAVKVAELVFDGRDAVPTVPGSAALVVVHVGPLPPPAAALLEKYPEALTAYPVLELAPTRKALLGGKRLADLFRVTPEIAGFQATRIAASLTEPARDVTLLVSNVSLPPGGYALLANGTAYELQVK